MKEMNSHIEVIENLVMDLSSSMGDIHKYSSSITEMLGMIKNISKQTRLLSLNASIEAAKAHEFGKGFAVVAADVGKLADSSEKFAQGIGNSINQIQVNISEANKKAIVSVSEAKLGAESSREAFEAFLNIQDCVNNIYFESNNIFNDSQIVTDQAYKVLYEFTDISNVVEQTSASIEEVTASVETQLNFINESMEELQDINYKMKILNDKLK